MTTPAATPLPELALYAPDDACLARLAEKLRGLAVPRWEDSRAMTPVQLARNGAGLRMILLDYTERALAQSSELARQLGALLPGTPLVAVGSTHAGHANGVLAAWRDGVRDFVDLEASPEEIRTVLARVLQLTEPARRPALSPVARRQGRLVLLLGVRPGTGTTTLAVHLGTRLTESAEAAPAAEPGALLLDLGRPSGDAALYLGVDGEFHYEEAVRHASRIDPTFAQAALAHHASRLALLSQPAETWQPPSGGQEAALLVERLRGIFGTVLCDLGGLPCRHAPPELLQAADEIWLVADQSIGAMMSLSTTLQALNHGGEGARDPRLGLVLNRYDEDAGIAAEQVAERFALPLLAALPERSRALRTSIGQGRLLHETSPRDPYLRALQPLLERLHARPRTSTETSRWKNFTLRLRGPRWKNS